MPLSASGDLVLPAESQNMLHGFFEELSQGQSNFSGQYNITGMKSTEYTILLQNLCPMISSFCRYKWRCSQALPFAAEISHAVCSG